MISASVAADAFFVPNGLFDRGTKHNTGIFDRVMIVYLEVTVYPYGQVKKSVAGKTIQHMIKKSDTGLNI